MKKIKLRLPSRKVLLIVAAVLAVGLVSATVYQYFQVKSLKSRVDSIEYGGYSGDSEAESPSTEVEFKVLSQEDKRLRVEATNYNYKQAAEPEYETKDIRVFKILITNNSGGVYVSDSYGISAQTKGGVLISAINVHQDDQLGEPSISLAPGGSAEVFVYIPYSGEEITGLFDTQSVTQIKL